MDEVTFILDSCVHGYHMYKLRFVEYNTRRNLDLHKRIGNRNDVFAVAVQSDGNIIGHVAT